MSSRIIRKKIHVITRNDILTDREFFAEQFPWRKWQIALFEAEGGRLDDRMPFVSKVVFRYMKILTDQIDRQLISSIGATQSPFKVEEIGWGGFEVPISIFFHGNVRPFTFIHDLRFDYSVYESSIELEYEDVCETSDSEDASSPPCKHHQVARKTPKTSLVSSSAYGGRKKLLDLVETQLQKLSDEALANVTKFLEENDALVNSSSDKQDEFTVDLERLSDEQLEKLEQQLQSLIPSSSK
ncbi:hypothetical protein BDF19DRAFT_494860 [Syncephalis fuscata]|nr:hypothetical protein BDF19DRAFT_494860 [Syncephalis fuscata]